VPFVGGCVPFHLPVLSDRNRHRAFLIVLWRGPDVDYRPPVSRGACPERSTVSIIPLPLTTECTSALSPAPG
jgi:hypothetical protein